MLTTWHPVQQIRDTIHPDTVAVHQKQCPVCRLSIERRGLVWDLRLLSSKLNDLRVPPWEQVMTMRTGWGLGQAGGSGSLYTGSGRTGGTLEHLTDSKWVCDDQPGRGGQFGRCRWNMCILLRKNWRVFLVTQWVSSLLTMLENYVTCHIFGEARATKGLEGQAKI